MGKIKAIGEGLKAISQFALKPERGKLDRLPKAPPHVAGPVPEVAKAAEDYAAKSGIDLKRQKSYAEADPRRGRYIAKAYEKMPHAPDDPKVRGAYDALAQETMAQWQALQDAGAKIEFIKPDMEDPYPGGPKEALADLRDNHHLWVFPTESGYGPEGSTLDVASNPLLAPTGITHEGHPMVVNDAFRAVHDYFGHGMEGANFGARGEENAWQAHKRLFSPEAMPALTSETRGQNSWVNFGPYGDANRANQRETIFADQKTGVMPPWTQRESGMPMSYRAQQAAFPLTIAAAGSIGGSAPGEEAASELAPKGDRLGTPSKDETMQQRLALARQMSGSADRRATGATSPERPPEAPLTLGGSVASAASGLRSSAEGVLGSVGDLSFDTGLGFKLPLAANFAPTSEDVGKGTDWMVNKLPQGVSQPVQDWTRYESKNPVERAWKWLAEQASF